jgi:hypothetical protein
MTATGLSDAFFGVYSFDESSFAATTTARRRDGRDDDRARPAVTFAREWEYVARESIMEEGTRTENGRSLKTFVRWKRSFVPDRPRARECRSSRARGRSGTNDIHRNVVYPRRAIAFFSIRTHKLGTNTHV